MDNPETLATLGTQEWTIQRHWQHWTHKKQDKYTSEKTEAATKNRQASETGNIGHTRNRTNTR